MPLIMGGRIRTAFVALEKALCPKWPESYIFRSYAEETKKSYQFFSASITPGQKEGQRVFAIFYNENWRKDTGVVKGFDPEQKDMLYRNVEPYVAIEDT